MSLIKCPECKREISDKAEVCIHCGYPIAKLGDCSDTKQEHTSPLLYKIRVIDIPDQDRKSMAVALTCTIADIRLREASALIEQNYSPIIIAGLSMDDAEVIKRIFENERIGVTIEPDYESTQSTTLDLNAKCKLGVEAINYFMPKQDENDFLFCPRCRSKLVETVTISATQGFVKPVNICKKCGHKWNIGKR
ncbi:hypothetical protein [Extibacter muris]|uniref:hypothetical protein n=1 Tax=Extibacter muris TaxID=1796622 RepID=UPI001D092F55|nr:hypothetical protein [Extibacter muris]MCB6202766.1 hypothetical protein [Extibacter muris]MCQ4665845.1 hypothetical protein [Extibacter muris]MCQ4695365.1 hypothetical protein [Extibacter muris]